MVTLGEPVTGVGAMEVLDEQLACKIGHVRWLRARLRNIEPDALAWGLTRRKTAVGDIELPDDGEQPQRKRFAGTDEGDTFESKPNAWYVMYVEAARELEKLAVEMVRIGFDERRLGLAEQQAEMLMRVVDGILADLGHDQNDPAIATIVERHFALVA